MTVQLITLEPSELAVMLKQAAHEAISQYRKEFPDRPEQEIFTAEEAAEYLRFFSGDGSPNSRKINTLRKEGKLKAIEDAGTIRYTIDHIKEYLEMFGPLKNPIAKGKRV